MKSSKVALEFVKKAKYILWLYQEIDGLNNWSNFIILKKISDRGTLMMQISKPIEYDDNLSNFFDGLELIKNFISDFWEQYLEYSASQPPSWI